MGATATSMCRESTIRWKARLHPQIFYPLKPNLRKSQCPYQLNFSKCILDISGGKQSPALMASLNLKMINIPDLRRYKIGQRCSSHSRILGIFRRVAVSGVVCLRPLGLHTCTSGVGLIRWCWCPPDTTLSTSKRLSETSLKQWQLPHSCFNKLAIFVPNIVEGRTSNFNKQSWYICWSSDSHINTQNDGKALPAASACSYKKVISKSSETNPKCSNSQNFPATDRSQLEPS